MVSSHLYVLWYHHTYRCDHTRDCKIQFCPPDDEHMCSKHVESWSKLIIKFSASSWFILINRHNLLLCLVVNFPCVSAKYAIVNLTFICPCIANIFAAYNQQDSAFHNLHVFISVRRSTCFRRFFSASPGAQNCTYSVRYLSDQYCYLLLAWPG